MPSALVASWRLEEGAMDLLVGRDVAILILFGLAYGAVLVALRLTRR